jgi:ComF family protein
MTELFSLKLQIAEFINQNFWLALDWLYPPVCIACGEPGSVLCSNCMEKIKLRQGHVCKHCGSYLSCEEIICKECQKKPPKFTAMRTFADYEGVIRESVHALKYQKNQSIGHLFSGMLASLVKKEGWQVDLVIPVPLSPKRAAERGYNQAAQIAKPLALKLGVRYNPFGLKRIRNTRSQVGLSAQERRVNVAGAFEAIPELISGKKVLVIDDVITTGATFTACADALHLAGASEIYCLALGGYVQNSFVIQEKHLV